VSLGPILVLGMLVLGAGPGDDGPIALADAGHYKRARALAEARLKANPQDAEALAGLSAALSAFGDDDGARADAQKAVDLAPQDPRCHYQLSAILGTLAQKAGVFRRLGLARDCRAEIEKTLALDPTRIDAQFALLEFYLEAPGIAGGDRRKADEVASRLAVLDKAAGARARARIAEEAKDVAGEEKAFEEAIGARPSDYEALLSLASLYLTAERKPDLALDAARRAVAAAPGREAPYAIAAQALVALGRSGELDPLLDEADAKVGDDLDPYYQAGRVLLLAGADLPRAERYFRKFLSQEPEGGKPDLAHAHWRLALVLEKEGRGGEAASELEAALRLKGDLKEARDELRRLK
jgi:tetratricopeptide (TPR) repeat protein